MAIRNVLELESITRENVEQLGSMEFNVYVVAAEPAPELSESVAALAKGGKQFLLSIRDVASVAPFAIEAYLDDLEARVIRPFRFEGIELRADAQSAQIVAELSNGAAMRGWTVAHTASRPEVQELYFGGPKLLEQTKQVPAANSITWLTVLFDGSDREAIARAYADELAKPLRARYVDTGISDPPEFLGIGLTVPEQTSDTAVAIVNSVRETYPKFGSVMLRGAGEADDVTAWGAALWNVLHGGAEVHVTGTLGASYFVN